MKRAFQEKWVLAAAILIVAAGCDCGKTEPPAAAPTAAPTNAVTAGSQADPVFQSRLKDQVAERTRLTAVRGRLVAEMEAMVEAARRELPGADDAAIKAELEKKPEWKSLYARVVDVNAAIEDNRQQSMAIVRKQLTGK